MKLNWTQALPTLEQWDQLSRENCKEVAYTIALNLPSSFHYAKLEWYWMGDQQRYVAFFEWENTLLEGESPLFAFIPGGETTVGYDRIQPFSPTAEQRKSWNEETLERGFLPYTLEEFLDLTMYPIRQTHIEPFLLQIFSTRPMHKHNWTYMMRSEILEILEAGKFRFPTSDEWEYACAAGSRTLFRWGNDTPDDVPSLPDEESLDYKENFLPALTEKALEPIDLREIHRRPNAFGLYIGISPYHAELCAEPEICRCGDGGGALHCGAGTFVSWLSLASSYNTNDYSFPYFRRVYPLGLSASS